VKATVDFEPEELGLIRSLTYQHAIQCGREASLAPDDVVKKEAYEQAKALHTKIEAIVGRLVKALFGEF
jgi:hypothetical protein